MNGDKLKYIDPFEFDWITEAVNSDYRFIVEIDESENSSDSYLDLLSKVVRFHFDYELVAKKWKIGEIFADEVSGYFGENISESYLNSLEDYFLDYGVSFFPRIFGGLKGGLMMSSYLHYILGGVQIQRSIYGIEGNGRQRYFYDLNRSVESAAVPEENVIRVGSEGEISFGLNQPFEFFIMFQSELFFPYIRNSGTNEGKLIDNRVSALQNIPRFNSYLREVKALVVNDYNWKFEFLPKNSRSGSSEFLTSDGILFNKEIIFQENIVDRQFDGFDLPS